MIMSHCLVCNDEHRFNVKVSELKRKIDLLSRYDVSDAPNDRIYLELKQNLRIDKQHPHFMCGNCHKVNIQSLRNLEDKLDDILVNIAYSLEEKNSIYHETLRLLSGDYSMKYRVFERFCTKKFRKED